MAVAVGLLLVVILAVSAREVSATTSRRLVWKKELGSSDLSQHGRRMLQQVGDLDGEWEPVTFPELEEENAQSPSALSEEIAVAPEGQPSSPMDFDLVKSTINASQSNNSSSSSSTATVTANENRPIETEIVPMLSNIGGQRKPIHEDRGLSKILLAVIAVAIGLVLGGVWGMFYLKKSA